MWMNGFRIPLPMATEYVRSLGHHTLPRVWPTAIVMGLQSGRAAHVAHGPPDLDGARGAPRGSANTPIGCRRYKG